MKKSMTVGVIVGAISAVGVMASLGAQPGIPGGSPRYQMTAIGNNLLVLDNTTNRVTLLYKKRVDGKSAPDWPWAADNSFSLDDAITKPGGADISDGVGR